MGANRVPVTQDQRALGQHVSTLSRTMGGWLYVLALISIISLLAFVYLTQAGHVVQQIQEMDGLETRLRLLKRENNARLLRIAQYEQPPLLAERAKALGFSPPEEVQYIEVVLEEPATSSESPGIGGIDALWSAAPSKWPWWWNDIGDQFVTWIVGSPGSPRLPAK